MLRQPLTAYLLSQRVRSLADAGQGLRDGLESVALPVDGDLMGHLYLTASTPAEPAWARYVEEVTGLQLDLPPSATVGAALLVESRHPDRDSRVVAFTFGTTGRQLLKRSWIEHGFGLRCALNACFPRDVPADQRATLRSIDSKAFDEVALDTRQLASRQVGFEVFGMNIQTDLLRAVVGIPHDVGVWGSRVRGRDSFTFSIEPGSSLTAIANDLMSLALKTDYRRLFPWVDNIKPVSDDDLLANLRTTCTDAVKAQRLDLVGPDDLDLAHTSYYRIKGDRQSNRRYWLDIKNYVKGVGRANIDYERLITDWVQSYNDDGHPVDRKSIFECLAGDLKYDGQTYILADGAFYEVERDFIRILDRFVNQLAVHEGLPDGQLGESEPAYNERAALDADILLVDRRTLTVDSRTTPVEPCDLFSRDGSLIHVKRHVRSSTLSHLFSQGAVCGELLVTSQEFRDELRGLLTAVENERLTADPTYRLGMDALITEVPPARHTLEIVFAIIGPWRNRTAGTTLPFFSKLNLRQRAIELDRLGFKVSLAKVNYS